MNRRRCLWCRAVLVFSALGWVHESTGAFVMIYVQNGTTRDDHIATPDMTAAGECA